MEELDQPNILVVGDEQSIYRFQGAVMENIINFSHKYREKGLSIIPLTQNYRSSQLILDASRSVIRNNSESLEKALDLNKKLTKNNNIQERKISIIKSTDPQIEIAILCEKMKEFYAQGILWSDMGVIYRKNANPVHLVEYLRREKIPFHKQK
jgi:DNA helicase-2/ATP-dependent DNA helicase PcrA